MTNTYKSIEAVLPVADLAKLVYAYFAIDSNNVYDLAKNGEWEAVAMRNTFEALRGACRGGYIELVQFMIERGANDWNYGLWNACYGDHIEIVWLMIEKGAYDWNYGLLGACQSGHIELVQLMIEKGADDWNGGLMNACFGGHVELIRLMIEKGATRCYNCGKSIADHPQN
jgi:ankyrin repeat protein